MGCPLTSRAKLRSCRQRVCSRFTSLPADAVCGAGYGERSDERTNQRNGYRHRDWDTRAGTEAVAFWMVSGPHPVITVQ
ncbi:hypothetical protein GCM10027610_039380 [Dactylosporangium cerinum]